MPDLVAAKRFTYSTRALFPDQEFTANAQDARILVLLGKARYATVDAVADDEAAGDLTALRAEYQAVAGKKAFHGWDASALREKIAEARK